MEQWEETIVNSTNKIYARKMIYKIKEYQLKYKTLDVDSIALEFSSLDLETKKDWAVRYNNMQSIVSCVRVQKKIRRDAGC